MAVTIGDLTYTEVSDYGDGGSFFYVAQTFIAGGDNMQSLEFFGDAAGAGSSQYHVLITTVKALPGGEFQPDQVLKEVILTETFDADHGLHSIRVNLRGLELEKGDTYAFVIDRAVTKDGTPDSLSLGYNDNLYAGGFVADHDDGNGRASDFNDDWDEYLLAEVYLYDLAFEATFSDDGKTIIGGNEDDLIDASHAPQGQPKASNLDDMIFGNRGKDKLFGGAGFDYLDGGKDNDKLYGGDDGDVLVGGKGKDKLYGGDGENCYVFDFKVSKGSAAKNLDKIYNFNTAADAIYLDPGKFTALALGDLPDTDTHITYKNGALFYDGIKFAQFKGAVPASLDDIHIVVEA